MNAKTKLARYKKCADCRVEQQQNVKNHVQFDLSISRFISHPTGTILRVLNQKRSMEMEMQCAAQRAAQRADLIQSNTVPQYGDT